MSRPIDGENLDKRIFTEQKNKGELSMLIGERIKKIRNFRDMKQKDLGIALGFPIQSASVRIAQYENNSRIPKKETAEAIAKILKCNRANFLSNLEIGEAASIMMDLFWLEESVGHSMYIFQMEKYSDVNDHRFAYGMMNNNTYDGIYPPVAIALNYSPISGFMREWAIRFFELKNGQITQEEYFEWKINYPV